MAARGRPVGTTKRKPGDRTVKLTLSARQFGYLTWLVANTKLGPSEELVALRLLTDRMEEMSPSDAKEPPPAS